MIIEYIVNEKHIYHHIYFKYYTIKSISCAVTLVQLPLSTIVLDTIYYVTGRNFPLWNINFILYNDFVFQSFILFTPTQSLNLSTRWYMIKDRNYGFCRTCVTIIFSFLLLRHICKYSCIAQWWKHL